MSIWRIAIFLSVVSLISIALAQAATTEWTQYARDSARSGYNGSETTITTANVSQLKLKWFAKLDTGALAQPLLAHAVSIRGISKDVLYAATYYHLFAIDTQASDGGTSLSSIKVLWSDSFPGTYTNCLGTALHWGTWATPYIDRSTNRLYLADGSRIIRAVDLSTGASITGWNLQLDSIPNDGLDGALSFNPKNQTLYATNTLRCGLEQGSSPPVHGKIFAISTRSATVSSSFTTVTTPNYYGGDIWGMGGVSIDAVTGNVFSATGNAWSTNASFSQHIDYAEHVVSLSPSLTVLGSNYPTVTARDVDFGSTPTLYTPATGCTPQLAVTNKSGAFLFYNRGNVAAGPIVRFEMGNPAIADVGDFIGAPAIDPTKQMFYLTSSVDSTTTPRFHHGLSAFTLAGCRATFSWNVAEGVPAPTPAPGVRLTETPYSSPIVADSVVFFGAGNGNVVYANDGRTGRLLWTSPKLNGALYTPPILVNGRLYVMDMQGDIYAFGL